MDLESYSFTSAPRAQTYHAHVVHELGLAIVSGKLAENSILPGDGELMKQFDVSRTVLREAMKTLAGKGLVLPKARIGTRVMPRDHWRLFDADVLVWHSEAGLDSRFFESLSELRLAIEPAAAALAAARHTDKDVKTLQDCVSKMSKAETNSDFVESDLAFHLAVASASGNPFMQSISALIEVALVSSLTFSSPVSNPPLFEKSIHDHQAIADAIASGDQDSARDRMRLVIEQASNKAKQEMS